MDRYIPGYVFFSDGIEKGYTDRNGVTKRPCWKGNGLKVIIDANRELQSVESF